MDSTTYNVMFPSPGILDFTEEKVEGKGQVHPCYDNTDFTSGTVERRVVVKNLGLLFLGDNEVPSTLTLFSLVNSVTITFQDDFKSKYLPYMKGIYIY